MDARLELRSRGLRPKRSLGQHFLVDGAVARRIAALALEGGGETPVLEVGAGTGVLTAALRDAGAQLTALEIDPNLVRILRGRDDLAGVDVVEGDALRFDYAAFAAGRPWRLVGNLPYNVGTPLVAELVRLALPPERMVVMLQKDVIDRLVAKPRTPAYGSLTLVVGARMRARRAFTIGRSHFYPQPNVDSSVAVLEPSAPPSPIENFARFDQVVRAAFAYRRKTLVNSIALAGTASRERTLAALKAIRIDPESRAEQLDLAAFVQLADALAS